MTVAGVGRSLDYLPKAVRKADMPLMFPSLPSATEGRWTSRTAGGWPEFACDLVIVMYPNELELTEKRFTNTVQMMDKLSTALRAAEVGRASLQWTMRYDLFQAGDTVYHAVIAGIETAG